MATLDRPKITVGTTRDVSAPSHESLRMLRLDTGALHPAHVKMTTVELLSLLALVVGPIAAVLITRHLETRRDFHGRRMDLFRTLMRTRRVPMSEDHVGALNLIEIEFAYEPDVLAAWKLLYQHFATEHIRRPDEQRMPHAALEENRQRDTLFDKRLFDERQRLLAKVLHSMARTLNFNIEQLEIFEGGYTPQGWQDEFLEQRMARSFILDLYRGRAALPVAVLSGLGPADAAERPKIESRSPKRVGNTSWRSESNSH